jgi:hypothetical protein
VLEQHGTDRQRELPTWLHGKFQIVIKAYFIGFQYYTLSTCAAAISRLTIRCSGCIPTLNLVARSE